jgi:hypothetical protein
MVHAGHQFVVENLKIKEGRHRGEHSNPWWSYYDDNYEAVGTSDCEDDECVGKSH